MSTFPRRSMQPIRKEYPRTYPTAQEGVEAIESYIARLPEKNTHSVVPLFSEAHSLLAWVESYRTETRKNSNRWAGAHRRSFTEPSRYLEHEVPRRQRHLFPTPAQSANRGRSLPEDPHRSLLHAARRNYPGGKGGRALETRPRTRRPH